MILTGNVAVDPTNLEAISNAIIFKEGDSSERRALFTQWAQKMKQDGALAIIQLSHGGRQSSVWANRTPFGVSDIELKTDPPGIMCVKPVALTTEQVKSEVVDRFVYAAKFAYECGKNIRPVFKNTVVYLTGGFRTVGAMVDAVLRNTTQGIGLGRPATAEPDLPKKILNGSVLSAVQDAFNPNDLIKQMLASGSQLEQMGRNSVRKAGGNVMDQISDYSDERVVEVFNGKTMEMYGKMQKDALSGKAPKMLVVMN
ncbi:hypothetical protein CAEBREN_15794 [Caenorhabditis brenneri]|uniref:NADH:flavin oxidoreductase/NADH oxidase N-terminal domain-containing protein n=1 Tax=Caenorhabditis brenneri TaxID=135651 RepID=G0NWV7_CAEBE|nr:hypothetical protein CAEBREN_15794 [Caenorhabditis brenneri]